MKSTKKQAKKKRGRARRIDGLSAEAAIDLYDKIDHEFDHLGAVAELLELSDDRLEAPRVRSIGSLLADLHRRLEAILAEAYWPRKKMDIK